MKRITLVALSLAVSSFAQAAAEKGFVRGVGAGIAYPAASQGLLVNPAGTDEAGAALSVAGMYKVDDSEAYGSAILKLAAVSLSGAFFQDGGASEFRGGVAFRLGSALRLGGSYKTTDADGTSDWNSDVGAILSMGPFRFAAVARDVRGTPSRYDLGVGFRSGATMFEVNVKKMNSALVDALLVDAGMSMVFQGATIGFGYDTTLTDGEASGGGVHGGISLALAKGFFVEAFYRPLAQEWGAPEWAAGLRISL